MEHNSKSEVQGVAHKSKGEVQGVATKSVSEAHESCHTPLDPSCGALHAQETVPAAGYAHTTPATGYAHTTPAALPWKIRFAPATSKPSTGA